MTRMTREDDQRAARASTAAPARVTSGPIMSGDGAVWRSAPATTLGLVAVATVFSLLDLVSWDYWWQLRTGRLIWETGAVPGADPYSYTAPGAPYVDVHWLFQLGLAATHALGGHAAVVLGKLFFVLLTIGLIAPIGARAGRPAISGAALLAVLLLLAERIMPRAELPSFALLAGVLLLLDRARRPGDHWSALGIVGLQLVWTNTHGLFALGIAVVAIHLAGDLFDAWSRPGGARAPVARLAAVLAGSVAVAFVNPNGLQGVLYPLAQLGMIGAPEDRALGATIVELQPTLGSASTMMLAAAALLFLGTLAGLVANRRAAPARDWLIFVAFLYLALVARRNLALFAIVAAPIAVTHANAWLDARPGLWTERRNALAKLAVLIAAGLLVIDVGTGAFHQRLGVPRQLGLGVMPTWFSLGAADWIAANLPPGPIAHHMADGGVFIERLWPTYPVMVDGRLEVYGAELFDRLQWSTPEQFLALHREYRFGTVVVHYSKVPSHEMLAWLQVRPAWKLVFVDEVSAVYVRDPDPEARFAALDVDADDLFAPLVDAGRVQTELRVRGRALFYAALRRQGRARAAIAWAKERYPDLVFTEP